MGVHGLWPLLHPVARPVALETMGGKKLAIDSSIWLYQFQIAMRDKDGRALDNAHILGFLRRICKLLFYGIKPVLPKSHFSMIEFLMHALIPFLRLFVLLNQIQVFVFDGGAPLIKKIAISNRKNRKQGAKETAAKTAEKLLNAQLRAAAVAQAQKTALENETGDIVDENSAVYMDDDYGIAPRGAPVRTRKRTPPPAADGEAPLPKKKKYVHKDQYALPVIDGPISANAKPSDPRLATEAELRSFIDEMRPEDFDMDSEFFANLPIEVKYEIIGDLRIKSRQANFKRVEAMRNAPTALDFSRAQIVGLSNRNVLTQKLLSVTDSLSRIQPMAGSIGRIAGERNKEYVLIKNDASTGAGYILGVRDKAEGTKAQPVKIDTTTTEESDNDKTTTDEEFEAVAIPKSSPGHHRYSQSPDPELRRELALEAIKQRYSPVKKKTQRGDSPVDDIPALPPQKPLFRTNNGVEEPGPPAIDALADFMPDFDLWEAMQRSVEEASNQHTAFGNDDEEQDMQRAIEQSRVDAQLRDMRGPGWNRHANGDRNGNAEAGPSNAGSVSAQDVDEGDESDVSFDEVQPGVKKSPPKPAAAPLSRPAQIGHESDHSDPMEGVRKQAEIYARQAPQPRQAEPDSAIEIGVPRRNKPVAAPETKDGAAASAHAQLEQPKQPSEPTSFRSRALQAKDKALQAQARDQAQAPPDPSRTAMAQPSANSPAVKPAEALSFRSRALQAKDRALQAQSATATAAPAPLQIESEAESGPASRKPAGLHLDIPPAAKRPLSSEEQPAPSPPDQSVLQRQAERDTSPQLEKERDGGIVERDYAQQPSSPPRESDTVSPNSVQEGERQEETVSSGRIIPVLAIPEKAISPLLASQQQTERPSLMMRTLSGQRTASTSPPPSPEKATAQPRTQEGHLVPNGSRADDAAVKDDTIAVVDEGRNAAGRAEELDKGDLQAEVETGDVAGPARIADKQVRARSPEVFFEWSPSPEPISRKRTDDPTLLDPSDPNFIPSELLAPNAGNDLSDYEHDEDEEQRANLTSEQREYAKFLSELKNKNLDEMEYEVQNELRVLNEQNKRDRKLADDITQQMAKDIQLMLKVLGLPYVVAPMEAEAQCAELLHRNLVDGVITDDNDVFLFGATRVYKNMFNQNKYVECYLATDIDRELALDREKLIRLAHFLGSDYCDGLPGVGPVLGMELMAEFPGSDGLVEFRQWWMRVQKGRDTPADNLTAFKRKFKKSKKELYVDEGWPNPEVAKAYLHPVVDDSEEPFAWGIPDLDAMRDYLKDHLGWGQTKTDELMLPIIRRMTGRAAGNQVNQSTISSFFDVSGGTGRYAPMANKGYQSKRLQNVVKAWRQSQQRLAKEEEDDDDDEDNEGDKQDAEKEDTPSSEKKAKSKRATSSAKRGKRGSGRPSTSRRGSSNMTKASSSSRQSSRRPSQRGESSDNESDEAFNAELEAKLAKMGVKRKREAPVGSDRVVKPARRSKKEAARLKAERKSQALFAAPSDEDDEDAGKESQSTRSKGRKKTARAIEDDEDYEE